MGRCRYGSPSLRPTTLGRFDGPPTRARRCRAVGHRAGDPRPGDDGDECTRSSWRSTLKRPEKRIIKRESHFSTTAANPTSSAFGLGQLIHANRRRYAPQVGADPAGEGYHTGTTDPCEQLRMMRLYIEDRYGSISPKTVVNETATVTRQPNGLRASGPKNVVVDAWDDETTQR